MYQSFPGFEFVSDREIRQMAMLDLNGFLLKVGHNIIEDCALPERIRKAAELIYVLAISTSTHRSGGDFAFFPHLGYQVNALMLVDKIAAEFKPRH